MPPESEEAMTALAVLVRARAILAEPSSWTKGAYARKSKRAKASVAARDSHAVCWCLEGALVKAFWDIRAEGVDASWPATKGSIDLPGGYTSVTNWNDRYDTRHRDVLRVLDRSIAALSGDAGGEEMR